VPALEFSKFICQIFALDEAFSLQAANLKKNLLTLCHFKEFSPEAMSGNEPSLVLVIPDVICTKCQNAQDLDICRDMSLNPRNLGSEMGEPLENSWVCSLCDEKLQVDKIERRLIEMVNRRVVSYQMQDVKCKNCRLVTNNIVSRQCNCTGSFIQTLGD